VKPSRGGGEAGDDDADDEAGGMRSVWLAMRDEEPSGRELDALMAAASAKASVMRERSGQANEAPSAVFAEGTRPPGDELTPETRLVTEERAAPPATETVVTGPWWARWVRGVWRPSTLAFASVVVLIGSAWVVVERAGAPMKAVAPASESAPDPTPRPSPAQTTAAPARLRESGAPAAKSAPSPAAMFRDAEEAAVRGDCAKARTLIEQIDRADADYRAPAAKSTAIARCLAE
jgi:hypothetical protein